MSVTSPQSPDVIQVPHILGHRFLIDLHVHTRRYSQCAELLNPDHLLKKMKHIRLHGVVIAEHDSLWEQSDIRALNNGQPDLRIYRGVEISSSNGHFVVIGLDNLNGIYPRMPVQEIVYKAHNEGAVVILAHHHISDSRTKLAMNPMDMPDGIHAIEVMSTATKGKQQLEAMQYAYQRHWNPVAGSDAHAMENVGAAFTAFEELPIDEKALAAAIKSGKGIPISRVE